jgi:hypothetical protein
LCTAMFREGGERTRCATHRKGQGILDSSAQHARTRGRRCERAVGDRRLVQRRVRKVRAALRAVAADERGGAVVREGGALAQALGAVGVDGVSVLQSEKRNTRSQTERMPGMPGALASRDRGNKDGLGKTDLAVLGDNVAVVLADAAAYGLADVAGACNWSQSDEASGFGQIDGGRQQPYRKAAQTGSEPKRRRR